MVHWVGRDGISRLSVRFEPVFLANRAKMVPNEARTLPTASMQLIPRAQVYQDAIGPRQWTVLHVTRPGVRTP